MNFLLINEEKYKLINNDNIQILEHIYHFEILNMNKDILKYSLKYNINDKINYDDKDEIFNNIFENNCFIVDFKEFFKYNKKFTLSLVYYCFIKLYNDYFIKNGELITLFNELTHKTLKNRNIKILYLFNHNILLYKIKLEL